MGLSISSFQKYGTGIGHLCQTKLWNQIFSFKVESLTFTKIDRLTITQRIKNIKTYYKNRDFATATYPALIGDYGLHYSPTMQAIGKIAKTFEEIEVVIQKLKGLCIIVLLFTLKTSLL